MEGVGLEKAETEDEDNLLPLRDKLAGRPSTPVPGLLGFSPKLPDTYVSGRA